MLKNYFKIAWRNLINNKIYSLICIIGLSLGVACSLLLFLFVQDELSFDRFHQQADDIYTVKTTFVEGGETDSFIGTPGALAATLKSDYPQVDKASRIRQGGDNLTFIHKENKIKVNDFFLTDPDFFDILSYTFICGNKEKALIKPNSLVLTERLAKKLFRNTCDALGKTITMDNESYSVTGVCQDTPDNTLFKFEAIASINTIPETRLANMGAAGWMGIGCSTLLRLQKGEDYEQFNQQIANLQEKYFRTDYEDWGSKVSMELIRPLDVRLYESDGGNTIIYIYILSTVGLFILLIATINYINLATARSITRAKEVGIRKVIGSYRLQLIKQFLIESFVIVTCSIALGLFLAEIILPAFNQLSSKSLSLGTFVSGQGLLILILLSLFLTFASGFYPAVVLSAFDTVMVLKGKFSSSRKGIRFRRGLVTFQFVISVVMIIATWGAFQQMSYIFNKDMGFDRDQIVIVNFSSGLIEKAPTIRERMLANSNIQSASLTSLVPAYNSWAHNPWKAVMDDGNTMVVDSDILPAGYDYVQTLGIELLEGRDFSPEIASDCTKAVLVNEAFVKKAGWDSGLGKEVERWRGKDRLKIIGVMKDFHIFSLKNKIDPVIMHFRANLWNLVMKVNEKDMTNTLAYMKKVWEEFEEKEPFEAQFLDIAFAKQYEQEQIQSRIFLTFSMMAIFIACLGLFGLATYTVQLRNKEIGIRKVLGAKVMQIVRLLSLDFLRLVFLAAVIAIPIAIYLLNMWLQNFAYRISIWEIWYVFIGAGILASMMSILTIGFQTLKAARTNPVKILRDE